MRKKDNEKKYIWFDWAVKHILRDKANFGILEGFISVIIGQPMKIIEIIESEGNQDAPYQKFNRVDIKAKNDKDEIVIVEVQTVREMDFLERMVYGTANAVQEQTSIGKPYSNIHKIYTIAIVYFGLGRGKDYLYHGQTILRGVHDKDELIISRKENDVMVTRHNSDIFPEYYLVRVKKFKYQSLATAPIDQWMNYLKTGDISENDTAQGLPEAREKLRFDSMSPAEQKAYIDHVDDVRSQQEAIDDSRAEGRAEGAARKERAFVRKLHSMGMDLKFIAEATGLTPDRIEAILKEKE